MFTKKCYWVNRKRMINGVKYRETHELTKYAFLGIPFFISDTLTDRVQAPMQ